MAFGLCQPRRKPSALADGALREIYWVRGPRTACQLGLPAAFGLGDQASLLPLVHPTTRHEGRTCQIDAPGIGTSKIGAVGFMPHFESLTRGALPAAATASGVTLIDLHGNPRTIISQIAGCRTLLSEALHGVIVADELRIPWVALAPVAPVHRAKCLDWADALDLTVLFEALLALSPCEYIETKFAPRRPDAPCRSRLPAPARWPSTSPTERSILTAPLLRCGRPPPLSRNVPVGGHLLAGTHT
jgi:hypothetical protein